MKLRLQNCSSWSISHSWLYKDWSTYQSNLDGFWIWCLHGFWSIFGPTKLAPTSGPKLTIISKIIFGPDVSSKSFEVIWFIIDIYGQTLLYSIDSRQPKNDWTFEIIYGTELLALSSATFLAQITSVSPFGTRDCCHSKDCLISNWPYMTIYCLSKSSGSFFLDHFLVWVSVWVQNWR